MSTITNLTEFRKSKKMTAAEAGKLFGVKRATVYRWENGKIKIPTKRLEIVESVTGIPRQELRPDIFGARR